MAPGDSNVCFRPNSAEEMVPFNSESYRQGKIDLATLADLLGHESLNTTARYLHPDRAGVAAMVEEL